MSEFHLPDETIELPLKEGEVYKNYKEMCKALGEEERTGQAKQNQLRHWQMHFDYEREGFKYRIIKIIDSNYRRWYSSKSNRNIKPHSELIQKLLLNLIYDYSKKSGFSPEINDVVLNNKLIAEMLAMVNKSYYHYYAKTKELAKKLDLSVELAQDFYMRYNTMFTNDIRTAIKQLENRKLIYTEEVTVYREYLTPHLTGYELETIDPDVLHEIEHMRLEEWEGNLEDNEQGYTFKFGEYRLASSETLKKIVEVEHVVMKSLESSNMQAVRAKGLYPVFQRKVIHHLREFHGIAYYFKAYKIVFSPNLLQYIAQKGSDIVRLSASEEVALKVALNSILQENITTQYKRYSDSLEKFLNSGKFFGDYYEHLPPSEKIVHDNSEEDIQKLLKSLINIKVV